MMQSMKLYSYKNLPKSFPFLSAYCPAQRPSIFKVSFFYDQFLSHKPSQPRRPFHISPNIENC